MGDLAGEHMLHDAATHLGMKSHCLDAPWLLQGRLGFTWCLVWVLDV